MPSSTNPSTAPVSPAAGDDRPARLSDSEQPGKMLRMHVSNYSATKKVGNGYGIKSPRLDAGGKSWRIIYYPNGMRVGTTESISLYLHLDTSAAAGDGGGGGNDEDDVEARFKFVLPGPDGGVRFMSDEVVATFNRLRQNSHGFERFITRDDLEKSGCIRDDYFYIRCESPFCRRHAGEHRRACRKHR
ncbi:unnamed protein product [Urochloa humidicola]